MSYRNKVKKFNDREDYLEDVNTAKLLLQYSVSQTRSKGIFLVGTGLGGDTRIIKDIKGYKITGIEPRESFHKEVSLVYSQIGVRLLKMDLGRFAETKKKASGIFLFIHSINHIPKKQLSLFKKILKNSYIVIVNPNPQIEKISGKTDSTVISYRDAKEISNLLGCEVVFDFFYNPKTIRGKQILLREAILLSKH